MLEGVLGSVRNGAHGIWLDNATCTSLLGGFQAETLRALGGAAKLPAA